MGRFINADVFATTGQGILGNNMLVYCLNNPIYYIDEAGTACCAIITDGMRGTDGKPEKKQYYTIEDAVEKAKSLGYNA